MLAAAPDGVLTTRSDRPLPYPAVEATARPAPTRAWQQEPLRRARRRAVVGEKSGRQDTVRTFCGLFHTVGAGTSCARHVPQIITGAIFTDRI